jgi:hypothetical protein
MVTIRGNSVSKSSGSMGVQSDVPDRLGEEDDETVTARVDITRSRTAKFPFFKAIMR